MTPYNIAPCPTTVKGDLTIYANPMSHRALRAILADWLTRGMRAAKLNQSTLAAKAGVSRDTIWAILNQKRDTSEESLQKLSGAIGQPLPELSGDPRMPDNRARRPGEPRTGAEWGKTGRGGEIAEIAADPDYPVEGSGLEPQISDDEVLDLLLFNRQGFTRYLMTRFEQPIRLPMAARLGFLNYLEGLARDRGKSLPADHLDHLRGLIRSGGL